MNDTGVVCIRMLRDAELRGQQVIAAARDRRLKRVKQAKIDAQADVEQFRRECEARFNLKCDEISMGEAVLSKEICNRAAVELDRLDARVKACSPHVVNLLENLVCHVEPQFHHNLVVRRQIDATDTFRPVEFSCDMWVAQSVDACVQKCEQVASGIDTNNNTESCA